MEKGNPRRNVSASLEQDHQENKVKKRVTRACDRCRAKKAKCDGADPCHRCQASNTECTFQRSVRARDRVIPKGYVEMLESDRQRLIDGLQKLYRYTSGACPRDSVILPPSGQEQPLVHEILGRLHVLPAESESQKPPCQRSSTETTIDSSATDTFNMDISSGSLCEDGAMSPPPPAGIDIPMTEPLWSMLDSGYTVRNQDLVTISDAMTNSKLLQAWEEWPMQMATGHLFSTTFSLDNGFMDETQWLPYNAITDWMGLT